MSTPVDQYTQSSQPSYADTRNPARTQRGAAKQRFADQDWSMSVIMVAVWMLVIPIGGLFIAVNGGYSIVGLGVISNAFNDPGRFLWATVTAVTFPVPVKVPGLPVTQPLVPWCIVIATSLLQIVTLWRKITSRSIPAWVIGVTIGVSVYDLATTFFGFGTVEWIHMAGYIVQGVLAILITFGFESIISFLLRKV